MKLRTKLRAREFKLISITLVALMLWHVGGISIYAQGLPLEKQQEAARRTAIISSGGSKRFDGLLGELRETIKQGIVRMKAAPEKGFAGIEKLKALKEKLNAEHEKNEAYFNALEEMIKDKKLGDEILNRQRQFTSEYEAKYKTLIANVSDIESAQTQATGLLGKLTGSNQQVDWDKPISKALDFLEANTPKPEKHHFDPHNLPHRTLKADHPIMPKLTRAEWDKAFSAEFPTNVSTRSGSDGINTAPSIRPLGTAPPTAADLAETIEVKFTPEIKALADSLNKNPVNIYNWVRNNIEFTPTWGSIQGAELCMENRAGNAFDTSSLLIALLRYSGIPARYQMGTIEVPIEKFKNWAGGFTNAEAAASLFASAGVPSVVRRVNQNGQVVSVKLEHIWVKTFVDYAASAAAVNKQGDNWIDLDPTFKQFEYTNRIDFRPQFATEPHEFADQVISGGIFDRNTGFLTNLNTAAVDSFINRISSKVQQSQANLTADQAVANYIGSKIIRQTSPAILPAALPYKQFVIGGSFASVPANLRHYLTVSLDDGTSNTLIAITISLPEVSSNRLALNYVAATAADVAALTALASAGNRAIPSSVLVLPQIRLNEQPVVSAAPASFGTTQILKYRFSSPTIATVEISNQITAGEQFAIGLDLGNISSAQSADEAAYFESLKSLISNQPDSVFDQKVPERVLNSTIWSWFHRVDLANRVGAGATDAITLRYPSAGLCFLDYTATTLFGAAAAASATSFSMDIDRDIVITEAKNGDASNARDLARIQGTIGSALEARLPALLFSESPLKFTFGSTATLHDSANSAGVLMTEINQSNAAAVIPSLNLPQEVKDEFADAINAGMTIVAPQSELSVLRFHGIGYVVRDDRTGAASYLISGGLGGGLFLGSSADPSLCGSQAVVPRDNSARISEGSAAQPSNSSPSNCDEQCLQQISDVATTAAGGKLSTAGSLLGVLNIISDTLSCLAKQGINNAGTSLFELLETYAVGIIALLIVLTPFGAAIGAAIGGVLVTGPLAGAVAFALALGVDLVIGSVVDRYSRQALNWATGCP